MRFCAAQSLCSHHRSDRILSLLCSHQVGLISQYLPIPAATTMSAAGSAPTLQNVYYGLVTRVVNGQTRTSTVAVCIFISNARERGVRASQGLVLQRSPEELGLPPNIQLTERMEVLVKYSQDPSSLRQRIFRRERPAGTCIAVSNLNRPPAKRRLTSNSRLRAPDRLCK